MGRASCSASNAALGFGFDKTAGGFF